MIESGDEVLVTDWYDDVDKGEVGTVLDVAPRGSGVTMYWVEFGKPPVITRRWLPNRVVERA